MLSDSYITIIKNFERMIIRRDDPQGRRRTQINQRNNNLRSQRRRRRFINFLLLVQTIYGYYYCQASASTSSGHHPNRNNNKNNVGKTTTMKKKPHKKHTQPFQPGDPWISLNHEALQILENGNAYIHEAEIATTTTPEEESVTEECYTKTSSVDDECHHNHHSNGHCDCRRRRLVIVQDVHAPTDIVWEIILDFNHYYKMMPKNTILESIIYQRMPLHDDKTNSLIEAIHTKYTIGFPTRRIMSLFQKSNQFHIYLRYEYHPKDSSLIWSLDYPRQEQEQHHINCDHEKASSSLFSSDDHHYCLNNINHHPDVINEFYGHWHAIPLHTDGEEEGKDSDGDNNVMMSRLYYSIDVSICEQQHDNSAITKQQRLLFEQIFLMSQSTTGWVKEYSELEVSKRKRKLIDEQKAILRQEFVSKMKLELEKYQNDIRNSSSTNNNRPRRSNINSKGNSKGNSNSKSKIEIKDKMTMKEQKTKKTNTTTATTSQTWTGSWTRYILMLFVCGMILYNVHLLFSQ